MTFVIEAKWNMKTKKPVFQRATLDGLRQDLPDGTHAEIGYDDQGRVKYLAHFDQDQHHCEFEGSIINVNPENGVRWSEGFCTRDDWYPNELGPMHITRDRETGEVIGKRFKDEEMLSDIDEEQDRGNSTSPLDFEM